MEKEIEPAIEAVSNIVEQVESILAKNPLAGSILESSPLFSKMVIQGNTVYYCENPEHRDLYIVYVQPRATKVQEQRLKGQELGFMPYSP